MPRKLSANGRRIAEVIQKALDLAKLPPPLSVSQWADQYRFLSSESSSKQGRWTTLPMQAEPMDAVLDPTVESVALMWASQTAGKTEIVNNVVAYFIDQDPAPILVLQPTVEMAEAWSKDRLSPMVRDTPRLRNLIKEAKSRDSKNTIRHKQFPGGHITIVGANAPAGLAMRPIRVVVCDEISRYPASAGVEGDPIALALKRTDTFWDAVSLMTSTPTVAGQCRIEAEFELSDKRFWFCPCPECEHWQILKWAQVKWPEGEPEKALYICENCRAELTDRERVDMICKGQWRPTAPFNGRRGYHLSGLYTLFRAKKGFKNRLHQMASNFLVETSKGEESIKTLTNTFFAETWKARSRRVETHAIMSRVEKYGPELPAGVLCLVGTVDLQIDRIEFHLVGFGHGDEAWAIDYGMIPGNPHRQEPWRGLAELIDQDWTHAGGQKMRCAITFIDSGGQAGRAGFNRDVYRFVRARQMAGYGFGCWASKGASVRGAPLRREARQKNGIILQMIGTDEAKSLVYSRLDINEPGPRFIHFPDNPKFDAEYFNQLTAEEVQITRRRGFDVRDWVKIRDRNEALDLWAMAYAALDKLNPDWKKLHERYNPTSRVPEPGPARMLLPRRDIPKVVRLPRRRPRFKRKM